MSSEQRDDLPAEPVAKVTVLIRKSSSRDGTIGHELRVTDAAGEDDIAQAVARALRGHQLLTNGLEGSS